MKSLEELMQEIYDLEINMKISSFWDGDWNVVIGDQLNGVRIEGGSLNMSEVKDFLSNFLKGIYGKGSSDADV